ncbi:MAG: hypothetical protein WBG32_17325 [Nodosilinea sp.]
MKRFILCTLSATMALAVGATAKAQTDISSAATYSNEGVMSLFELRQNSLTRGVLSPDDSGPNNRAVNTTSVPEFDAYNANDYGFSDRTSQRQDADAVPGVVAPNSQGPNNRATPAQGTSPSQRQQPMMDMQNQDTSVPGVVAPNSQGPNNRATPAQGTSPSQQQPMMDMQNQDTSAPGVVAPNSQGPNNRATPGQ